MTGLPTTFPETMIWVVGFLTVCAVVTSPIGQFGALVVIAVAVVAGRLYAKGGTVPPELVADDDD